MLLRAARRALDRAMHAPTATAGVAAGGCAAALAAAAGPPPADPEAAVAKFFAQVNMSAAEIEAFLVGLNAAAA